MNIQPPFIKNSIFTERNMNENMNENSGDQIGGAYPVNAFLPKDFVKPLENYAVPMGIVLNNNKMSGGEKSKIKNKETNKIPSLIDDHLFDKLYINIHIKIPFQTNITRKNRK